MVKVMWGYFTENIPFANLNPSNLSFDCGCKLLSITKDGKKHEFMAEPKCLEHLTKYDEWGVKKTEVLIRNMKLTYKWNVYEDGKTEVIQ